MTTQNRQKSNAKKCRRNITVVVWSKLYHGEVFFERSMGTDVHNKSRKNIGNQTAKHCVDEFS